MKYIYWTFSLAIFFNFISCGENDKTKNSVEINENELLDTKEPKSIVKDSITYYNGNQKKIEVRVGEYFGFLFEANEQELEWELDPKINYQIAYISEVYEPEIDLENNISNGKQYFTFNALKAGQTTVSFKAKNSKESKTIQIEIK